MTLAVDVTLNPNKQTDGTDIQSVNYIRVYLQIAETYSFLPREAVTRFLMACSDCQKRMHIGSENNAKLETNNNEHTLPLLNGFVRPQPQMIDFR